MNAVCHIPLLEVCTKGFKQYVRYKVYSTYCTVAAVMCIFIKPKSFSYQYSRSTTVPSKGVEPAVDPTLFCENQKSNEIVYAGANIHSMRVLLG